MNALRNSCKAAALAMIALAGLLGQGCTTQSRGDFTDRFPNETTVWWPQPGAAPSAGKAGYRESVIASTIGLRPENEYRSTLGTLPKVSLPGEYGGAFVLFTPGQCAAFAEMLSSGSMPSDKRQDMVQRNRLIQAPYALWPELDVHQPAGQSASPAERLRIQSGACVKVAGMLHIMEAVSESAPLPDQEIKYGAPRLLYVPDTCIFYLRTDDNRWLQPRQIVLGEAGWQTWWDEPAGETSWKQLGKKHRIMRTFLPITLLYDAEAVGPNTKWVELHLVERRILPDGLKDPHQAPWVEERPLDASARARHLKGRWTIKRLPATQG